MQEDGDTLLSAAHHSLAGMYAELLANHHVTGYNDSREKKRIHKLREEKRTSDGFDRIT